MLAHNYSNGVDKRLVSGSNYAYSMTKYRLLAGFLFRHIFIVVLFISKDFTALVFTVAEKAKSCQTYKKTTEIKEAIQF